MKDALAGNMVIPRDVLIREYKILAMSVNSLLANHHTGSMVDHSIYIGSHTIAGHPLDSDNAPSHESFHVPEHHRPRQCEISRPRTQDQQYTQQSTQRLPPPYEQSAANLEANPC